MHRFDCTDNCVERRTTMMMMGIKRKAEDDSESTAKRNTCTYTENENEATIFFHYEQGTSLV